MTKIFTACHPLPTTFCWWYSWLFQEDTVYSYVAKCN